MDQLTDDNHLARLAAGGDAQAFRQLLERHYDMLFRVAFRFCGHREQAEDIAQDVCVSLPSRLAQFEGRSSFSTWLCRIVINRARDVMRRRQTETRATQTYGELAELQREETAESERQSQWLQEMLTRLEPDLRETAILVVGEGLGHRQAAAILGVREGTVSWRMSELKKALRRMAKEDA